MKKLWYPAFLLVFTFLLAEVTLRLITSRDGHIDYLFGKKSYFLPPFEAPEQVPQVDTATWFKYNVYDAQLGWAIGKLGEQPPYYSDHRGYRCARQTYDSLRLLKVLPKDSSAFDVVCIGDSFTHGDEVAFEQTWPYLLEKQSGLRTLNLGVGGYGVDQAWLRYEKERPLTKVIILGLVAGDLDRSMSQIYNLMVGGLKSKPMFTKSDGELKVVNRPAIYGPDLMQEFSLGASGDFLANERNADVLFQKHWYTNLVTVRTCLAFDVWARHRNSVYRTEGDDLDLCIALLSLANQKARDAGARFVVLPLDNLNTFVDWDKYGNPWTLLMQKLDQQGIEYWSYGDQLYKEFKKNPDEIINKGLVHYTPRANEYISKFVSSKLNDKQ